MALNQCDLVLERPDRQQIKGNLMEIKQNFLDLRFDIYIRSYRLPKYCSFFAPHLSWFKKYAGKDGLEVYSMRGKKILEFLITQFFLPDWVRMWHAVPSTLWLWMTLHLPIPNTPNFRAFHLVESPSPVGQLRHRPPCFYSCTRIRGSCLSGLYVINIGLWNF